MATGACRLRQEELDARPVRIGHSKRATRHGKGCAYLPTDSETVRERTFVKHLMRRARKACSGVQVLLGKAGSCETFHHVGDVCAVPSSRSDVHDLRRREKHEPPVVEDDRVVCDDAPEDQTIEPNL